MIVSLSAFLGRSCAVQVASCNGVGKSTIVAAIHFVLGNTGTTSNSREKQQQLLQFVTFGCQDTKVILALKGFAPAEVFVVERRLVQVCGRLFALFSSRSNVL